MRGRSLQDFKKTHPHSSHPRLGLLLALMLGLLLGLLLLPALLLA